MPTLKTLIKPDIEYDFCAIFNRDFPNKYTDNASSPIIDSNGNRFDFNGTAVIQCVSEQQYQPGLRQVKVYYRVIESVEFPPPGFPIEIPFRATAVTPMNIEVRAKLNRSINKDGLTIGVRIETPMAKVDTGGQRQEAKAVKFDGVWFIPAIQELAKELESQWEDAGK